MENQKLPERYIEKNKLITKLKELFSDGNYKAEVSIRNYILIIWTDDHKKTDESWILTVPRKLTEVVLRPSL